MTICHAIDADVKKIGAASQALWSLPDELYDKGDRLLRDVAAED
jgi:hypothetical protein